VIVEHRQRMAAALAEPEVALEVHLPQGIGFAALEALERPAGSALGRIEPAMAAQDPGHRRGCRHTFHTQVPQPPRDLAATPGRMRRTHFQHPHLHLAARPQRTVMRPPRTIRQARRTQRRMAPQQAMARVPADPETAA